MALVWLVVLVCVAWPVALALGLLWIFLQVRVRRFVCVCVQQSLSFLYVLAYFLPFQHTWHCTTFLR